MKLTGYIYAMAALLLGTGSVFAADDAALLRVSDIKVSRVDNMLTMELDINPRSVNPGRDKEVVFTPVVRSASGSDSVVLPSVTIAGRNRYYSHLRNKNLKDGAKAYAASSKETIEYRAETPFLPWMEKCRIDMRQAVANCCQAAKAGEDTPLALLDYEVPAMEPEFQFVELTGDSAIELTAEGRAYVDFIVNRTEIRDNYRRNKVEIAKIIESIDKVKNDPDATITRITIKGFASPEGPYDNNVRLAMGRTASLKEYVRKHYNFDNEIMFTDYEPEDWAGLKAWVEQCTLPHKTEILQIIDSPLQPDPKNSEIQRRYPQEYKLMLDSVYPGLRHSDYTVKYRICAYATVEELLEVFAKTPERMRPVDFQRIAAVYPVGSARYNEIMLKAVEIHPNDPEANVNAAGIALRKGDRKAADRYLAHAGGSGEAIYMRGVAASLDKDYDRARKLFDEASDAGFAPAADERDKVDAIIHRQQVTYLITPETESTK